MPIIERNRKGASVQPIEIFKAGTHTAMDGRTLPFSEADVAAIAAAYDPALHEAPIVVGHPRDNAPAYGWVAGLAANSGALAATPQQVDAGFAEMVLAGRFKKVSASFYTPDSPANPKPGGYYLRHVGFLGAQPPAVKGLKPVAFAESEAGVVEFSDAWTMGLVARLFSGLRDFIIAQFGQDRADAVLPRDAIDTITANAAAEAVSEMQAASPTPDFREAVVTPPPAKEPPVADITDAAFAEREAAIAAREAAIVAREREDRSRASAVFLDGLIAEAKFPAARRGLALAFMEQFGTTEIQFGEAGAKTPLAAFQELLSGYPPLVELREVAGDGVTFVADQNDAGDIVRKSIAFQEAQRAQGIEVTNIEAVKAVTQGTAR